MTERGLSEPDDLLDRARTPRSGLDRRIVRHDADRASVDPPHARDDPVGRQRIGERVREEPVLRERAGIEQTIQAVAHEHLVLARELVALLLEVALQRAFDVLVDPVVTHGKRQATDRAAGLGS